MSIIIIQLKMGIYKDNLQDGILALARNSGLDTERPAARCPRADELVTIRAGKYERTGRPQGLPFPVLPKRGPTARLPASPVTRCQLRGIQGGRRPGHHRALPQSNLKSNNHSLSSQHKPSQPASPEGSAPYHQIATK